MNPEDLHPAERRRQMRRRDAAFGGFLYIGWMLATGFLLRWLPATLPGYWHVGAFLAYPALVLSVPAALVGMAYTVVVGRERALWLLLLLVVTTVPVLWVSRVLPTGWSVIAGFFIVVLTILSLFFPLLWFFRRRSDWSHLSASEAQTELERGW